MRVDEPGGDGEVLDPDALEVQRGRRSVDADVGDVAARPHQLDGLLERRRDADGLHGDVGAETVREVADDGGDVVAAGVESQVGAEFAGRLEPAVGEVDRDDVARAQQSGGEDRGEADRAGTDDDDDVGGTHASVEHADLVGGGQDVGEHEHLLVAHPLGHTVGRVVGERHSHEFGLGAVDEMAEDPATAAEALAVAALAAEAAAAARGDARDEDPVAGCEVLHARPDLDDGADGLVAEDAPVGDLGDVAAEDVQVGAADGDRVDADDRVGGVRDSGVGDVLPGAFARTVEHQCLHWFGPFADRWVPVSASHRSGGFGTGRWTSVG
ncbi:dehydrogenase [Rhodococcus ruber BKS 20-38]|uniref:Dehydrogenase n=1 Tax=Rhodococcus ruber BKS 20-38 TaxID=1278076 RepID=M2YU11_9NOCA|nr:dehydrogenase [Rhodococcus ruber BKS 20-38]